MDQLQQDEYHRALGGFIEMYARAESGAHMLLWHYSGIDMVTARAIWPSMRLKEITANLRKLYRARKQDMDPLLDEALSHFILINGVRDSLVHYATFIDDKGNRYTTNEYQAQTPADAKVTRVSPQFLTTLVADLGTIVYRIVAHLPPAADNPDHVAQWEQAKKLAPTPWLYKPPQQGNKGQSSR
jgi:hypothetical protein